MHQQALNVVSDAPAVAVVADVGQEIDIAAQPGQSDRNVERAAAHVLGGAVDCSTMSISASPITSPRVMPTGYGQPRRRTFERMGSAAEQRVKLTNADKVLYPATGTTKGDVFDYYTRIAEVMVPHIAGRPATRKRWPNGVEEPSFFEKQLASSAPDWLPRASVTHRSGTTTYPIIDSARRAGLDRAAGGAGGTRAAVAVRRRVDPKRAQELQARPGNTIGVRPGPR